MQSDIEVFFRPRSIAVIGASPRPNNMGHVILNNLRDRFRGKLYVVNPGYTSVEGIPSYPSMSHVPEDVDLVVVAVKSTLVPQVLEDAGTKGVKGAVIFSGGFAETGTEEGRKLQDEVIRTSRKYNIRVLGPNCIGVYDYYSGVDTLFLPRERMRRPPSGPIALISQSGALMATLMDWAAARGIGIGRAINFGNKVDIDEVDSLKYLSSLGDVKVTIMYLEGVTRGRELVKAISRSTHELGKPVVILKGGRSDAAGRATLSHTASMVGNYSVFKEAMREAGAVVVESLEEMFEAAEALAFSQLPAGDRVAVVTNSGGHGVIAFDNLIQRGLKVPEPSETLISKLRGLFPERVSLRNPFDLTGDATPAQYRQVLEAIMSSGEYDSVLLISLVQPPTMDPKAVSETVLALRDKWPYIPMIVVTIGAAAGEELKENLMAAGIPTFEFPDSAARALSALARCSAACGARVAEELERPGPESDKIVNEVLHRALKESRKILMPDESLSILKAYGVQVADFCVAMSSSDVRECLKSVGAPAVMKVLSPNVVHKSDVGGVVLGVSSVDEAENAYTKIIDNVRRAMPDADIRGVMVQRMVSGGVEVIVGGFLDPSFGPTVTFGAGGLLTELIGDSSIRLAPVGTNEALKMIEETRVFRLLRGYRGLESANLDALARIISRVSILLDSHRLIKELDINPVLARSDAAIAVDSRIVLEVDQELG